MHFKIRGKHIALEHNAIGTGNRPQGLEHIQRDNGNDFMPLTVGLSVARYLYKFRSGNAATGFG